MKVLTVCGLFKLGFCFFDRTCARGYVSRKVDSLSQPVFLAGGRRKGEPFSPQPCFLSSCYSHRDYYYPLPGSNWCIRYYDCGKFSYLFFDSCDYKDFCEKLYELLDKNAVFVVDLYRDDDLIASFSSSYLEVIDDIVEVNKNEI